jgi:citrate synthase
MGFGHRVYKNYDPRAKLMRETCHEVLDELGRARRSAVRARDASWRRSRSSDDYFIERKLVPERRLLLGHHPEGAGHSGVDVHRASLRWPARSAGLHSGTR